MEINKDFGLIKDLLIELYFEDDEVPNEEYDEQNVLLKQINEKELQKEFTNFWIQYLGSSKDFQKIKELFLRDYSIWKKLKSEFNNSVKNSDIIAFLEENFEKSIEVGFKLGEISQEQIKEILNYRSPQISKNFKGWVGKYINLLVFSNDFLHITLHLKLDSFYEESFILTTIFSFWFEQPKEISNLDINFINNSYANSVLMHDLLKRLESLGYREAHLFNKNRYRQSISSNQEILNEWVNGIPQYFLNVAKQTLNVNPLSLFDELVDDLNALAENSIKNEKKTLINPKEWFDNLNQELKLFYHRGKELFLNISNVMESISPIEKPEEEIILQKEDKDKQKLERIILSFQKALEEDLNNTKISHKEKGFRTFHQIFTHYFNKKTREGKYDFIKPISQGKFYSLVNKYKQELESILEKHPEKSKGGGDLYRIISFGEKEFFPSKILKRAVLDEKAKDIILLQRRIHEGLFYYKNQNYRQTLKIFQNILDSNNSLLKDDEDLYLGILYYIGKCHFKTDNFHDATESFREVYDQNKTKIDAGFKLLLSYFNSGDYLKAKSLAHDLYSFLEERLNPYRSLDTKDLLFEEYYPYLGVKLEDLHPNVLNMELFNKYLIMLDRAISIRDYKDLYPRDYADWEEYQRKLEMAQDQSYHLSVNLYTYRKLKFTLFNILHYFLEIYRRLMIQSLVFNEDKEHFKNQLTEVISFLKEEITKGAIRYQRINDFLLFIKKLTELILKDEKDEFENFFLDNFPEFDGKTIGPTFYAPKESKNLVNYLFYMTMALPNSNFQWVRQEIEKGDNFPEFIAESMLLELISLINYDLENIYQKTETDFDSIEKLDGEELNQLFPKWKHSLFLYGWGRGINYIRKDFEIFIEFCESHNLSLYLEKLKYLVNQFEMKLTKIIEKKSKGRKEVIKKLLKKKYEVFEVKKYEITVDLRERPDSFRFDQFFDGKVLNELFKARHQKVGEKKINFLLFDQTIAKEIYQELLDKIDSPSEVHLNVENDEIIYKEYYWTMPTHIKSDFYEFLDYFLYDLFDMFEMKADKYCVKYIADMKDDVRIYFQTKFIDEFKNPYFDFTVKDHPDGMYYSISIKKKGVT